MKKTIRWSVMATLAGAFFIYQLEGNGAEDNLAANPVSTFGKAILGLAPTQPYVKSPQTFIEEVTAKMGEQREEMLNGEGRAGDNIRAYMASVRAHNVKLDPTVMVALMSMLVLEGWQFRLDPSTSIVGAIETLDRRRRSRG